MVLHLCCCELLQSTFSTHGARQNKPESGHELWYGSNHCAILCLIVMQLKHWDCQQLQVVRHLQEALLFVLTLLHFPSLKNMLVVKVITT